ncbi:hypothetical protein ABB37_02498 [Leptomonas pyrrhocoris]|uniref:Uncharacterized protein n=1 Tax=Leptomonas pyrrhocoris TaxID=157538 RepID=A0A0N0DX78_LEPPY|nr:hypothetical protein ABB37_02498 [Leptomonas pyrrhocoris]XP_015661107.1 hypothetical protein ABB37_02498 [Leptomonas pyrrhocoris]KPA82667.1 hypothetical protein ABB37_02498 [Leptomonas pyrrhocoris]KPA82668.1 hypothetical protein ABB37_02498 [Leptomonas pyrrhocoris]|eukprot:XP_015661106.1 hypothetical protein ABB37_02498 [Leptomonas pyrrhocoris]
MPANGAQSPRGAAFPVASVSAAAAEADADTQQLVNLVNRFVISSVQFLNRFAEECESKLIRTDAALRQLELQTQLLEHMLLSSGVVYSEGEDGEEEGEEGREDGAASTSRPSDAEGGSDDEDSEAAYAYDSDDHQHSRRNRRRRRHRSRDRSSNSDSIRRLPAPPGAYRGGASPPAAPGAYRKGPSMPPPGATRAAAAAQEAAAARLATLAIVGAPVLLPQPSESGEPPAPPPPLELRPGRLSMRTHPKLKGYYELLSLRVPAAFVKAKMQADGYQADWLDTPDAPAPATLSTVVRAFADEPD